MYLENFVSRGIGLLVGQMLDYFVSVEIGTSFAEAARWGYFVSELVEAASMEAAVVGAAVEVADVAADE